ncbi:hypothetical protein AZE42_05674 [Rhizopogon vesiculosus]|uniref:Uncharacterized protein n=1 Tax=Rhizopogon vesiculosus TaxID=180088 RepID=A0A1J8QHP3_9AGAM|nr:hypothetical protein AZE42_05674 [Rhizopogon vesiculosus]
MVVSLSTEKTGKYLMAIHKWHKRRAHILQDVQELYGKLLHTCSVIPQGRAYLMSLESMLSICGAKPFVPHRPEKHVAEDLDWWSSLLQSGGASRPIYPLPTLKNPHAYSDTSSGIGIGIVIGDYWHAWRLIPGWQTSNGKRDIGWVEAIGFELLIYSLATLPSFSDNLLIHGDNTGVVEGWWKSKHWNRAVNHVFHHIHEFILNLPDCFEIHTTYITSDCNPADGPSRGIYGPQHLLLPPVGIPESIREFIIDATEPLSSTELRHLHNRVYTPPAAKFINRLLTIKQANGRTKAKRAREEELISRALYES